MDLEFKRKKGKYIKKMAKRRFRGPKKKNKTYTAERRRKVCVTGPLMVRMMRFFFTPPADLFELENVTQKRRNVTRSRYVASVFFFFFFFLFK